MSLDLIRIRLGDLVPADVKLVKGNLTFKGNCFLLDGFVKILEEKVVLFGKRDEIDYKKIVIVYSGLGNCSIKR